MKGKKKISKLKTDLSHNDSAYPNKIKFTISGIGNPLPVVIFSFLCMAIFFYLGLFLLFGDIEVVPELFDSQIITKIIAFLIMFGTSCLFLLYAIVLCKRLKIYNCQKRELENYSIDETINGKIAQRTCPKCGDVHDIDYPKCPKCGFDYYN